MLTLALVDMAYRQKRIWQQAALEHALIAGLAIILTGLAGLLVVLRQPLPLWHVGLGTLAIAMIYVFGMRVVFRQEDMRRRAQQLERLVEAQETAADRPVGNGALKRALTGFAWTALGILVAAPILAESAKELAEATGISATFIGTSLVAVTTTLPELVTTFAAVRLGAYDLAVGNLFGSNAFNMAVLLPADLAYWKGPLLAAVEPIHAVTAFVSILLMSIGMMGIIYRAERRFMLIEPDSLLMIVSYGLSMWLLFRIGA
jgi:cation:H+ antiporter